MGDEPGVWFAPPACATERKSPTEIGLGRAFAWLDGAVSDGACGS